jgi:elongation factor 1-alpha
MLKSNCNDGECVTIEKSKIVVMGNVDSGKSSFIGVMVSNKHDDGNGSARLIIAKHPHERETGRTSSVSHHYIHDVNNNSKELITLVDLCGHQKYYNNTLQGVTFCRPDFGIIIISGNDYLLNGMTKEHMRLLYAINIPFIILITKFDSTPTNIYQDTKSNLIEKILKKAGLNPILIEKEQTSDDNLKYCKILNERGTKFVPIICISNKTGFNIPFIRKFLSNLKSPFFEKIQPPFHLKTDILYLDSIWNIKGMGLAVSGYFRGEKISLKDTFYIGPNKNGDFFEVYIKSIHNACRENVSYLQDGSSGSVVISFDKKIDFTKRNFRKGMFLVRNLNYIKPFISKKMEGEIKIYHHHTTITNKYQTVIHNGVINASAFITLKDNTVLRSGDREFVNFTFNSPQLIEIGQNFYFREGKIMGKGIIKKVINE